MRIGFKILLFTSLILFIAGCSGDFDDGIKVNRISANELNGMLKEKDFILVDVHVPEQEHIPRTDLVIAYDDIENNINKLPKDKDTKIVVYCRSGSMSNDAASQLIKLGYTNIYDLQGGVNAYKDSDYNLK